MICKHCGKEISYVRSGKCYSTITDCTCGSYYIDIPVQDYTGNVECPECGQNPFEELEKVETTFVKVKYIKQENIDDIL